MALKSIINIILVIVSDNIIDNKYEVNVEKLSAWPTFQNQYCDV